MLRTLIYTIGCIVLITKLQAQGVIDGYMKGANNTDVVLTYSTESYDRYRFGTADRNVPATFNSVNFFMAHALSDSMDVVLALPFIWTDANNKSLQDATLALKYRNQRKYYEKSALSIISSAGASFPASDYSTRVFQPIGEKAITFQARLLAQYELYSGFFFHIQTGYDLRIAPNLRNGMPIIGRIGFGSAKLYADAWIDYYRTFNAGVDTKIAGGEGSTWLKIGGTIYYAITPKMGAFIGGAHFLDGENIGLASRFNVGVVYKHQRRKNTTSKP